MKKTLALLLALAMVFSLAACANSGSSGPSSPAPEGSSAPAVTIPDDKLNADVVGTVNPETQETGPVVEIPTEAVETRPVESLVPDTEPVESEPAASELPFTEPAETEPLETAPAETEPVETEPAETEPAETEPVETEPIETEPPEPVENADVVGTWKTNLNFGMLMDASMAEADEETAEYTAEYMEMFSGLRNEELGLYLTFGADGNARLEPEEESFRELARKMLHEVFPALLASMLETDVEGLEAMLAEEGKTMDDLLREFGVDPETAGEEMLEGMNLEAREAPYTVAGDKLNIGSEGSGSVMTFRCDGENLIITEIEGAEDSEYAALAGILPWSFVRSELPERPIDNPDDENSLAGMWETYLSLEKLFEMSGEEVDDTTAMVLSYLSDMDLGIILELGSNGLARLTLDEDSVRAMGDRIGEVFPELLAAELDMDLETLEATLEQAGMTWDDFYAQLGFTPEEFGDMMLSSIGEGMNSEIVPYTVDGSRLILLDEDGSENGFLVFERDGDALTVTSVSDDGTEAYDNLTDLLPWRFVKVGEARPVLENPNVDEELLGDWETYITVGQLAEEDDEELMAVMAPIMDMKIWMILTFDEDGAAELTVEEASLRAIGDKMAEQLPTLIALEFGEEGQSLEEVLEDMDMTLEEIYEMLQITPESYSEMMVESLREEYFADRAFAYTVEGDQILLQDAFEDEEYVLTYTVAGDELTVTDFEGDDDLAELFIDILPWYFTRG